MLSLPPWPAMTRLHRESRDAYLRQFTAGMDAASLEMGRLSVAQKYGCTCWQELRDLVAREQGGLPGEPDPGHVSLLVDAGAGDHSHTGASLLDHLHGTWDLLVEWGSPPDVAVAGLFHSIYGTESYKIASVPLARRHAISDRIGVRAERLAHAFCVSHRADLFSEITSASPKVRDVLHDMPLDLAPEDVPALIEIEVANVVEQVYPERAKPTTAATLRTMLEAGREVLSEGALLSLQDMVQRIESCRA